MNFQLFNMNGEIVFQTSNLPSEGTIFNDNIHVSGVFLYSFNYNNEILKLGKLNFIK
jgi:hypothetical protein